MQKKVMIPLFLKNGKAVKDFEGTAFAEDIPVQELAQRYGNSGADALVLFDLSSGDAEHEQSLNLMRQISRVVDIPLIGGGNISRLEDVKKLLYAGCEAVFLNYRKESNVALTEEAAKRFGKEKIAVCTDSADLIFAHADIVGTYASQILLLGGDLQEIEAAAQSLPLPVLAVSMRASETALAKLLAAKQICGVCGGVYAEGTDLNAVKQQAKAQGIAVRLPQCSLNWSDLKQNSDGMVPVVVQDYKNQEVLMVAYMNEEAFQTTVATGKMTYWSRSRQELWVKGATSGHLQYVKKLSVDCDKDTLLAQVHQIGAACHTGNRSCFYRDILKQEYQETSPAKVFEDVYAVIEDRRKHPKEGSYTNYLFEKGIDKILKKVGEEATEIVIAAKNPNPEEIKYEIADFLYHVMVLMSERGVTWEDITSELANR